MLFTPANLKRLFEGSAPGLTIQSYSSCGPCRNTPGQFPGTLGEPHAAVVRDVGPPLRRIASNEVIASGKLWSKPAARDARLAPASLIRKTSWPVLSTASVEVRNSVWPWPRDKKLARVHRVLALVLLEGSRRQVAVVVRPCGKRNTAIKSKTGFIGRFALTINLPPIIALYIRRSERPEKGPFRMAMRKHGHKTVIAGLKAMK